MLPILDITVEHKVPLVMVSSAVQRFKCYTAKEVAQHDNEDDLWVTFKGKIYDLTDFSGDHPGGRELITDYAGGDITEAFSKLHLHSNYAQEIMNNYQIGVLDSMERDNSILMREKAIDQGGEEEYKLTLQMTSLKDDNFIDLNLPLMNQVWGNNWSKNYYLEQVHIPRYTSKSPTFFANPFLEVFTKNTWHGVLLVWIPVIFTALFYSIQNLPGGLVLNYFLDGLVLWTLLEYFFHRFIFHISTLLPANRVSYTLHFLIHGVHHFLPMDRYRLVMPPLLLVALSIPVISSARLLFSWPVLTALLSGTYSGYVVYDMMHYYFHHGKAIKGYLARMKTYHMDHHYLDSNMGFGVSNLVWDAVFDTLLPIKTTRAGLVIECNDRKDNAK